METLYCKNYIEYLGEDKYKIITYHNNGQKKCELKYENGKPYGNFIKWHENGKKHWDYDIKIGREISWIGKLLNIFTNLFLFITFQ